VKGCQILAEMTTQNTLKLAPFEQLNQNDGKPWKNVKIEGNSIGLGYP